MFESLQSMFEKIGTKVRLVVNKKHPYGHGALVIHATMDAKRQPYFQIEIERKHHQTLQFLQYAVDVEARMLLLRYIDSTWLCINNNQKVRVVKVRNRVTTPRQALQEYENHHGPVFDVFSSLKQKDEKNPTNLNRQEHEFLVKLHHQCRNLKFLNMTQAVYPAYQNHRENYYQSTLIRITRYQDRHLRSIESWEPRSHNAAKQFHSLLRHLFAKYPIPDFLDSVWFRSKDNWIQWYIEIGSGMNLRKVSGLPIPLTKKMAHHVMNAPNHFTIEEALRWGQIMGLGGSKSFYEQICKTHLPPLDSEYEDALERNLFWQSVLEWFLRHPMLDPVHYGPIIDFIHHIKYSSEGQSDFKISGRSPQAILRLVDEWHLELGAIRNRNFNIDRTKIVWASQGMNWSEYDSNNQTGYWEMVEINSFLALREEGEKMRHCVVTRLNNCIDRNSAIFSLRLNGIRKLTVEYLPKQKSLGEIRGYANRLGTPQEKKMVARWAQKFGIIWEGGY